MQYAEKLSITLPAEMVRAIRGKVMDGSYGSNSEVIREALRSWMGQQQRLLALDAAIERGVADAEEGRVHDLESARSAIKRRTQQSSLQKHT